MGEHEHGGHVVTTNMGEDLHRLTNTPSITCLYVNVKHDRDDTKDGREKLGAYFCKSLTLPMKWAIIFLESELRFLFKSIVNIKANIKKLRCINT